MGVTSVEGIVTGPGGRSVPARFLVDSGATYSVLGVVTLEILGLVLNPFTRALQPMRMLLA
jgi:hypothetical protein